MSTRARQYDAQVLRREPLPRTLIGKLSRRTLIEADKAKMAAGEKLGGED